MRTTRAVTPTRPRPTARTRPCLALVLLALVLGSLAGCASSTARIEYGTSTDTEAPRATAGRDFEPGGHWIHDARQRSLEARIPFWHQPTLVEELELDDDQVDSFDALRDGARRRQQADDQLRRRAEHELRHALAAGDTATARAANRRLGLVIGRLARLDGELKAAVLDGLRPPQRRLLARFHPGLLRVTWLPTRDPAASNRSLGKKSAPLPGGL